MFSATISVFELALDMDNNGTFESKKYFHRLLGDVNGSGAVDAADKTQVLLAQGATYNAENDVKGDGFVNITDTSLVTRAVGRKLKGGLFRDDQESVPMLHNCEPQDAGRPLIERFK